MIIIGIDPGTKVTGYGLIKTESSSYRPIDFGCIRPPSSFDLFDCYHAIFEGVEELISQYKPDILVVETQFMKKNVQSAIKLGMARGSVIVAARRNNVTVVEYGPRTAKKAVVGTGNASKCQVQGMIQKLLGLSTVPPEDAADALALAICHANRLGKTYV